MNHLESALDNPRTPFAPRDSLSTYEANFTSVRDDFESTRGNAEADTGGATGNASSTGVFVDSSDRDSAEADASGATGDTGSMGGFIDSSTGRSPHSTRPEQEPQLAAPGTEANSNASTSLSPPATPRQPLPLQQPPQQAHRSRRPSILCLPCLKSDIQQD